ncbi:PadR family transcriptional regulator [Clostridium sp.]|uniref:PadR family transcriptional regulator n=1 Tax=Clostridium sp. TaxID=1506 RepID=UPI001E11D38E|nr:PadR family transcriptional regulator [Clostridium sp.]MBS5986544.1 PadR family transcriptional regulator [Clostridium sp.]
MSTNSQLLKGLMDGVILKIINNKETYGYEIYETLQELGFTEFAEGSLYPLLLRLEKKKLIKGTKRPSPLGPDRKYYSLTSEGLEEMESFKTSWDKINSAVSKLWI